MSQTMHVIAVVSQKGGSGKTTLSGHLSVQAERSGHGPVAVIDCDPQGSLAAWWNERENPAPVFVQTSLRDLRTHLNNLRQAGVRTVVIDTPPAITSAIHEVISIADYVLVPTKPSPHDLRAVGATVKLVQACAKPMVFVLNDASPRAKITFEAAIALSQHGTVAPVTVHHRTLFASSMIDGRTAMELEPNGQSAIEILGLWEYVKARLNSEVVPTAIGLDALRRNDGASQGKQAFALSQSQAGGRAQDEEVPEIAAPEIAAPEIAIEEPDVAQAPLSPIQPVEAPVAPVSAPISLAAEAQEAERHLWDGFAETPPNPQPAPQEGAHPTPQRTKPQDQPQDQPQVGRLRPAAGQPPRVFGRRQVRQNV